MVVVANVLLQTYGRCDAHFPDTIISIQYQITLGQMFAKLKMNYYIHNNNKSILNTLWFAEKRYTHAEISHCDDTLPSVFRKLFLVSIPNGGKE